jgi:serine/threonine protein kinase
MIGETLGHYRLLEKIGQGGMGEVFLAEDTSLHRKVALEFLPPAMQQDATAHKRFIREARSAAALDHPYISIRSGGSSEWTTSWKAAHSARPAGSASRLS